MQGATNPPPRAHWELLWFDRRSAAFAGECRVGEIEPGELTRALAATASRLESIEPRTSPEDVMVGEKPIDQSLADVLQPYISEAVDLKSRLLPWPRRRKRWSGTEGWGDFVEEP